MTRVATDSALLKTISKAIRDFESGTGRVVLELEIEHAFEAHEDTGEPIAKTVSVSMVTSLASDICQDDLCAAGGGE